MEYSEKWQLPTADHHVSFKSFPHESFLCRTQVKSLRQSQALLVLARNMSFSAKDNTGKSSYPLFTCLLRFLALAQLLITTACYHPEHKTQSFNLYLTLPKKLTGDSADIVKCSLCKATAWQRADLMWNEQCCALLYNISLLQLLPDVCKCSVSLPSNINSSFQICYSIQRPRVLFS